MCIVDHWKNADDVWGSTGIRGWTGICVLTFIGGWVAIFRGCWGIWGFASVWKGNEGWVGICGCTLVIICISSISCLRVFSASFLKYAILSSLNHHNRPDPIGFHNVRYKGNGLNPGVSLHVCRCRSSRFLQFVCYWYIRR